MFFKFLLTVVTAVSLCSCQQAEVNVEFNKNIDFFQFKTFSWLSIEEQKNKNYTSLKEQSLGTLIQHILAERGLYLKEDKPDVLVAVNLIEKEKVHFTPRFTGRHHRGYWGWSSHWNYYEPDYYLESTLVVAVIDPKTKKALWEGSVVDWDYAGVSDEEMEQMIRALLENYPPANSEMYTPVQ